MAEKGYTITYYHWDDMKEKVAGRFRTEKEKDEFLESIHKPGSGWLPDELETLCIIDDYNYMLNT